MPILIEQVYHNIGGVSTLFVEIATVSRFFSGQINVQKWLVTVTFADLKSRLETPENRHDGGGLLLFILDV